MPCRFLISAVASSLSLAASPTSQPLQAPASQPPPEIIEANAAVQGFVHGLRDAEWTKALGYCSAKVRKAAKAYPSPEAFFHDVVPIEQVVTQTKDPIYYPSCNTRKGGPWCYHSFAFRVAEMDPNPADKWSMAGAISTQVWWQGRFEKEDSRSVIDFPTTSLQSHIASRLSELRGVWDKAIATERELEPKLKDVHTRLTPLAKPFRVGESMLLRLELVNDGPAKLIYDSSTVGFFQPMIVQTREGEEVPSTDGPVQTAMWHKIIDPGQTVVLLDKWDLAKHYLLTEPGRYSVQCRGNVRIAEADPHKTILVSRGQNRIETMPAKGKRSLRRFPSNIIEIEVVATQPAAAIPGK